jgi:hypothetical protein
LASVASTLCAATPGRLSFRRGLGIDVQAETVTFNGSFLHNNVPGLGRVAHAGGHAVGELASFDPETLEFEVGDILFASAKNQDENFDVDWCEILRAQL